MALTPQREKFAQEVAKGNTQADAYRTAYPKSKAWKDDSVYGKASLLIRDAKVAQRVAELRERATAKTIVTIETLIRELEEARGVALGAETPQTGAAVSATMGKAKLLGLDKQVVEVSGNMNVNLTATQIAALNSVLDGEY